MIADNALVPSVPKPDTVQDLGRATIANLKAMVLKVSETTWNLENQQKENNFPCFHHTRHIVFRFTGGNRDHRVSYSNKIWDIWKPLLLPVMEQAIAPYQFSHPAFSKVMLARLAAGHAIDVHRDGAGSNLHTHKIHVPLITNPKALFTTNGRTLHLEEGTAYEVNNIAPHGVENHGPTDRIHLIFEVFDQST